MKLYTTSGAPNPDRVEMFLKEKGKLDEVELIQLNIMKGEQRSEQYTKKNPVQLVPTLELDDGVLLTESRAICTYLDSIFPEPNLMGKDVLERAQIEMWERRIEMGLFFSIANWFRHGHKAAIALEPVQIKELSELSGQRVKKFADFVDISLGETQFIAGSRFTNVDILLYICTYFAKYMRYDLKEGRENIARWYGLVSQRPFAQS